jgi:epoxide hydrolase-like predicted phosphatase
VTIKAIALDYGGVLTVDPFIGLRAFEEQIGCESGALCSEFRGGALWSRAEVGELAMADFWDQWLTRVRDELGFSFELTEVFAAIRRGGDLDPAMVDLVDRLGRTYRLAIMTNNVRESRAMWHEKVRVERFDVVVDSSEVGLRKPDPAIYDVLLERLGLPGSEVAYVDDFEENLEPAAALGMQVVHHRSAEQCEAELVAFGVDAGT